MDITNAINKRLALVLWAENEDGEDDVAVFSGVLIKNDDEYYLQRNGDDPNPEIRPEWLSRIKPVSDDLKEMLINCDYQLSLSVGKSEEHEGSLENFGLKWPE